MNINIKDNVLIINFKGDKNKMNEILDPISNLYEGLVIGRIGHNFPSEFIPKSHILYQYKYKCSYVIGIYRHEDLAHELLHAKFYLDSQYKNKIIDEWNNLEVKQRLWITNFLKNIGYSDKVIIDEYQAYRYTEPDNFFGIKL
jgi:hypothetical protein